MSEFFATIERTNDPSGKEAVLGRLLREAVRCWVDHHQRMAEASQSILNV